MKAAVMREANKPLTIEEVTISKPGPRLNGAPLTVWQTDMWPVRQCSHPPQKGERIEMTWSPGFTAVTIEPTCSTMLALSWPRMTGISVGKLPSQK